MSSDNTATADTTAAGTVPPQGPPDQESRPETPSDEDASESADTGIPDTFQFGSMKSRTLELLRKFLGHRATGILLQTAFESGMPIRLLLAADAGKAPLLELCKAAGSRAAGIRTGATGSNSSRYLSEFIKELMAQVQRYPLDTVSMKGTGFEHLIPRSHLFGDVDAFNKHRWDRMREGTKRRPGRPRQTRRPVVEEEAAPVPPPKRPRGRPPGSSSKSPAAKLEDTLSHADKLALRLKQAQRTAALDVLKIVPQSVWPALRELLNSRLEPVDFEFPPEEEYYGPI